MMIDTGIEAGEEVTESKAEDLPVEVIVSDPVQPVAETVTATADVQTMTLEQAQKAAEAAFEEKLKEAEDDFMQASLHVKDLHARL